MAVSDPWDFGTENGVVHQGHVRDVSQDERLLIELDRPVSYLGRVRTFFVAKIRHLQADVVAINVGAEIPYSFMSVLEPADWKVVAVADEFPSVGSLRKSGG